MGGLNVLFIVLSIRIILLVAVVGAIWLAIAVERNPDPYRLGALAIYTLVTVLPCIWLAARQSR